MIRKLNSKFSYQRNEYQVLKTDLSYPDKCVYCGFYDHVSHICCGKLGVTGDCRKRWRKGSEEVVFKEL